ncbi:TonB-dependent receptor domain-containing protein [Brevundimonas sp.]|uniref:TonB-dependent receptor domain-containing protein n=1 Tax=Brevundimonas sp. TaxID=1871086 RepID=UPI00286A2FE8|nr:TonB-dependent receptor [Brevundimonas sp.]
MRPASVTRSVLLAAVSAVALTGTAHAQSAPPSPQADEVDDIVVTGRPFGVSERASLLATDVIDEAALTVAPAATLGDLVAGIPGVRSSAFAPGASRPVIRGLSGPRVQVLTNGLGQIDASSVSPDHQVASDPAEARRIEVVRGPSTLVFGGSAIGGVVNIIDDRIASEHPEGGIDGHIGAQASSVDDGRSLGGRLAMDVGPLVVTVDGFTRRSEDYDVPVFPESARQLAEEGEEPGEERTVENTFAEIDQYGAGLSWIGSRGFLGLSVKKHETTYGVPGHEHGEEDHDHEEGEEHEEAGVSIGLEQTRWDLRGELTFGHGLFERLKGSAGWADYQHTEFEGDEVGTRFFSEGYEARAELIQRQNGGHQGVVGLQILDRDFDAQGDEAYVPRTSIQEQGVYTVQRFDLDRVGFEAGLRLDNRTLDSALAEREFTSVSGSLAGFVRPSTETFLGLSLSRTSRAPSEVELFAQGAHAATGAFEQGDVDLDSESVWTLEGTAHYSRGAFSADLHAYAARYDGFIDLRPTGDEEDGFPVFTYVQTDADFHGFEAEADYDLWSDGDRTLTLTGAADFVRAETDLGPAARIPPWSATLGLDWTSTRFDAGLKVRTVGEQDRTAGFELPTDGYTTIGLTAAWRPLQDRNVTVFAAADNLTDEEVREHASFQKDIAPQPGRNLRVGVAYRF